VHSSTEENLESLIGRTIIRVDVPASNVIELGVPDSEGWRLVLCAVINENGDPILMARWKPGLGHPETRGRGRLRRLRDDLRHARRHARTAGRHAARAA
jgi:hypothetical protein